MWIKTNKERNARTGYLQPIHQEPYSVLSHTKVCCLSMGCVAFSRYVQFRQGALLCAGAHQGGVGGLGGAVSIRSGHTPHLTGPHQMTPTSCRQLPFIPPQEHCLMGIKGSVRRNLDGHFIHANCDTDVIVAEEPPGGSAEKPREMYEIIERFCLGRRWVGSCAAMCALGCRWRGHARRWPEAAVCGMETT